MFTERPKVSNEFVNWWYMLLLKRAFHIFHLLKVLKGSELRNQIPWIFWHIHTIKNILYVSELKMFLLVKNSLCANFRCNSVATTLPSQKKINACFYITACLAPPTDLHM